MSWGSPTRNCSSHHIHTLSSAEPEQWVHGMICGTVWLGWAQAGALAAVTKELPWGDNLDLVAARKVKSKEKGFKIQMPNLGMILASCRGFSKGLHDSKGLAHLACEERLRELGLSSLEKERLSRTSPQPASTHKKVMENREHFSSPYCMAGGQKTMGGK